MTELNLEGYIAQEAARVAADYNFYWTVSSTAAGIKVKFETKNLVWENNIMILRDDFIEWSRKGKHACYNAITQLLERTADDLDNAEADYFAKKCAERKSEYEF